VTITPYELTIADLVGLASDRRAPFNQEGIFRHHPELDAS